mmetsp:Transcript_12844/g.30783  ORF Transcript_12844/g.30783 Transcript_12844/m.30783 type:complete len:306 (-) Transcript_12844:134-1051(-)
MDKQILHLQLGHRCWQMVVKSCPSVFISIGTNHNRNSMCKPAVTDGCERVLVDHNPIYHRSPRPDVTRCLDNCGQTQIPHALQIVATCPDGYCLKHPIRVIQRWIGMRIGTTLHHSLVEQAPGRRLGQMVDHCAPSCTLAKDSDPPWITIECAPIFLHPLHSKPLILHAIVSCASVSAGPLQPPRPQKPQHAEPIIHGDDDYGVVAGSYKRIDGESVARFCSIAATVNPHHDRQQPAAGHIWCRNIEKQTILTLILANASICAQLLRADVPKSLRVPDSAPAAGRQRRLPPQLPDRRASIGDPTK